MTEIPSSILFAILAADWSSSRGVSEATELIRHENENDELPEEQILRNLKELEEFLSKYNVLYSLFVDRDWYHEGSTGDPDFCAVTEANKAATSTMFKDPSRITFLGESDVESRWLVILEMK